MKIPLPFEFTKPRVTNVVTLFALLVAFVIPNHVFARQINEDKASGIANQFVRENFDSKGNVKRVVIPSTDDPTLKSQSLANQQAPGYYVFIPEDGRGFVIISGDDEMKPIVGYSHTGVFDAQNLPVQLVDYLASYERDVEAVRAGMAVAAQNPGGEAVAPLIKTKWDQSEPYNQLCIVDYVDEPFYTGCVATAMAQIMKYHNFPPGGHGVTEERWNNPSIDLSASVYDWANMRDEYDRSWTETEAMAVARLMRDIGAAVWMDYRSSASSAFSTYIAPAMYKYFNYSKDIRHLMREAYTSQEWIGIIRENLLRGEPILYAGAGNMIAHQFICDGIDADDYLHINWGWGGLCDGYFDINALDPSEIGIGGGDGNFYRDHDMVVNIRPGDPDADNSDYSIPLEAWYYHLSSWDNENIGADGSWLGDNPMEFALCFMVSNNTRRYINGSGTIYWCASLFDSTRKLLKKEFALGREQGAHDRDRYWESAIWLNFSEVEDGDYYVSLWYKLSGEDCQFDFASEPYLPVTVKDGKIYLNAFADIADPIEIIGVEQPDLIYDNAGSGELEITVRNIGKTQLGLEPITFYCLPEDNAVETPEIASLKKIDLFYPVAIYAGATVSYTVNFSSRDNNLSPGRYRLYFSFRDKIIETEEKYGFEISPMPSDMPFVLLKPFKTDMTSYCNTDHEWMEITMTYTRVEGWTWWYYNSIDIRVWAAPEQNPDDLFLLFEDDEISLSAADETRTYKISGNPDLLWKKPGKYRIWISYRHSLSEDWVTPESPNNSGSFTLVEDDPSGPIVDMAAPMIVNDGRPVVPGSVFDVTMRIVSPTGINIDEDRSYPFVTTSTSSLESAAYLQSMEIDKCDLAPGEETEVRMSFFMADNEKYYGQKLLLMLSLYYDEYYAVYPRPGEYQESLYFTVQPLTGIDDIKADSWNCRMEGDNIVVEGVADGSAIEVWSADGVKVAGCVADGRGGIISMEGLAKGLYIITVKSDSAYYRPSKIIR